MATQNAINQGNSTDVFTGVDTWLGAGNYYDDTTLGSFTILRGGKGYIKGVPVTWAGSQTITGLTAGNTYYIGVDSTGTIFKTTLRSTAFELGIYIILFECLRDSTPVTNNQVTVKEDHPYFIPYPTSNNLHDTVGSVIENANNGANIAINGTVKVQIDGDDFLSDHGLRTFISNSGGTAVTWQKKYTDGSGKWALQNISDTFSGYYNNAGTPTALGGSKFGVYTLYISKDNRNTSTPSYFSVLDTSQYNSQNAADTAISSGTTAKATNELAALELVQLGYIIFSQASGTIVQAIVSKSTLKQTMSTSGTNQASLVNTVVTNFDGILSSSDTNVQSALETIDDWGKTTTDHALLIGNGTGVAIGSLAVGATNEILTGSTGNDPAWSSSPTVANLTLATGGAVRTSTSAGNTLLLQAYDVDGTTYATFGTLTANNTPTMDLDTSVTIGSAYIYRAGGTDVPVADGGTGASTLTSHGVLLGNGTGAVGATAEGATGVILQGVTSNNPTWSTATYPSTVAIGDVLIASAANVISATTGATTAGYALVANGAGAAPTFQSVSGTFTWSETNGTSGSVISNKGYVFTNTGTVNLALPASPSVGDTIIGIKNVAGTLAFECAGSQVIYWGSGASGSGSGHGIVTSGSAASFRKIEVTYIATNTWQVVDSAGSWTLY